MVSDIDQLESHPGKPLLTHVNGVIKNVKKLTDSKWAELVAIYHDLGKINPNFQEKLHPIPIVNGYSNHAYLSAYVFFVLYGCVAKNNERLTKLLGGKVSTNDIIALTTIIAKHHRNLPDFIGEDYTGTGYKIISKRENESLFEFLNTNPELPAEEFARHFFEIDRFKYLLSESRIQINYIERFIFKSENNSNPLDFFLNTQYSFASLVHADKADAAKFDNFIDQSKQQVLEFCQKFNNTLNCYLSQLKKDTPLNRLRTSIRLETNQNIEAGLNDDNRVFELTAPTGSGKTLMLLSLAGKIMDYRGPFRVIYGLPFLSITEQVEAEVVKIFSDSKDWIQRIDSKSENPRFEKLQKELDGNPGEDKQSEMDILEFQENTFSYPFVITTFVRFFETLLSNRNKELLKLPNYSNSIFLLDEIQSLPPRLYGFFIAYLNRFCEKFNSYAIISTATQPNFNLPKRYPPALKFFPDYQSPYPLLSLDYFQDELFNRYHIEFDKEPFKLDNLGNKIICEGKSVLVILNTIDDTKDLYKYLLDNEVKKNELLLLNTHCIPQHRKLKIYLAKRRLRAGNRIILISTQLIEAGVDIDFPILYRDFATVSSIVQSAGRCNRNGELEEKGRVCLFLLKKEQQIRSELLFQSKQDKPLLKYSKDAFVSETYYEKELLNVQRDFFTKIQTELIFGQHSQNMPRHDFDFIKDITEARFEKIGNFQLIDKQLYGIPVQYYVARNSRDEKFEKLFEFQDNLIQSLKNKESIQKIKGHKRVLENHLRRMSNQIVQVRLMPKHHPPTIESDKEYFGLKKISSSSYSFEKGVDLIGDDFII